MKCLLLGQMSQLESLRALYQCLYFFVIFISDLPEVDHPCKTITLYAEYCKCPWIIETVGRGGSRIFFRRGCTRLLLYFNTNKPHSFFLQNTSCIREPRVISGGEGEGGAHLLHPPPRSAPGWWSCHNKSWIICISVFFPFLTANLSKNGFLERLFYFLYRLWLLQHWILKRKTIWRKVSSCLKEHGNYQNKIWPCNRKRHFLFSVFVIREFLLIILFIMHKLP